VDQGASPSAPRQRPPSQRLVIPGTRKPRTRCAEEHLRVVARKSNHARSRDDATRLAPLQQFRAGFVFGNGKLCCRPASMRHRSLGDHLDLDQILAASPPPPIPEEPPMPEEFGST
jgi:hypothetical protein